MLSQSRIPVKCDLRRRLLVDVKLDLSEQVIQTLSNAIAWWETWHKKPAPAIYVSSLYPKDFDNINEFGPDAPQKLRGM
jgi:hypothetical protein